MAMYLTGIPQAGQKLGDSRPQVQGNFLILQQTISKDHVPVNNTGAGFHNQITFFNFGSFPYPVTGSQSYLASINATSSGSAIVYQPSIVNYYLPISPRALCRITWNGATWAFGNDPYGNANHFNFSSVAVIDATTVQLNFANTMPSADYFVFVTVNGNVTSSKLYPIVLGRDVNFFQIQVQVANPSSLVIMVY